MSNILGVLAGVTGVISAGLIIAFFIFRLSERTAKLHSLKDAFTGESKINDKNLIQILKLFEGEGTNKSKLKALQILLTHMQGSEEQAHETIRNFKNTDTFTYLSGHQKSNVIALKYSSVTMLGLFVLIVFWSLVVNYNQRDETFSRYQRQYNETFFPIQVEIASKILKPRIDHIKVASIEKYDAMIVEAFVNDEDTSKKLEKLSEFYRSILICEKNGISGCDTESVNSEFGEAIRKFWFAYRPYIKYLRGRGQSDLAVQIEKKAMDILERNKPL